MDQWWSITPNANIGLWTVDPWALDVDGPIGRESLSHLEAQYGPLPQTLLSRTGRIDGGTHYLFRKPEDVAIPNTVGAVGEKLDTRGGSGYIVLPPSLHESGGRYQWLGDASPEEVTIAEAPTWLINAITAAAQKKAAKKPAGDARQLVAEGGRYNYLFTEGCRMRRIGMDAEEIYAALAIRNTAVCVPQLEDEEVIRAAKGAASFKPQIEKGARIQWSDSMRKLVKEIKR